MKTMTISSKPKPNLSKSTKVDGVWGVYNNTTSDLVFIGMSRNSAREYRSYFTDASHLTGPRKINITARLA